MIVSVEEPLFARETQVSLFIWRGVSVLRRERAVAVLQVGRSKVCSGRSCCADFLLDVNERNVKQTSEFLL